MQNKALIVGVSGITGNNLAQRLLDQEWTVYGLARNPATELKGLIPIAADLLRVDTLKAALSEVSPIHVFITSWMRNQTEAENIRINSLMVRILLDAVISTRTVQHVALVTGLKHYLGPFEAYAQAGTLPITPVREELPRLAIENFYYAQDDEVYAAAERNGFSWNIHRPHTVIGKVVGNMMNMGTTLAVYASICKETGRPFQFPGSSAQWNGLSDVTDARLLAQHMIWAATTQAARNQAFNVANGNVFRWNWLWQQLADWFGSQRLRWDDTPPGGCHRSRRDAVAHYSGQLQPKRTHAGTFGLGLTHGFRSGPPPGGDDGYVEEPQAGLYRLPGHAGFVR